MEPGPVNDSVLLTDRESETTGTAGGKHLKIEVNGIHLKIWKSS